MTCWRRQVPDISFLHLLPVGLSQRNAGRLSSNVWGMKVPSWHDTHRQRLQTCSRRRKHKLHPSYFSLYLVVYISQPRRNPHFLIKRRLLRYIWCCWNLYFLNLNHYILSKKSKQTAPCTLHVLTAWDPPSRFCRGPGSLQRTAKYLMKLKFVLVFLLVTWSQLHLHYTEQV